MKKEYNIALLPADGIGPEVIDAGWQVLKAAADAFGFGLRYELFDWSCDYYLTHGRMMPADGIDKLRGFDAIYLGAVGWPSKVPDSVSLHGYVAYRDMQNPYVNLRLDARTFHALDKRSLARLDVSTERGGATLIGPLKAPTLSGGLILDRATIYRALGLGAAMRPAA